MEGVDKKAIFRAVKKGDVELTRQLLKAHPASVELTDNLYGASLLHWACDGGHKEVARALLRKRADPNARNRRNATPLHWAVRGGSLELCHLLVKYKAAIEVEDDGKVTPLGMAEQQGLGEIAKFLDHVLQAPGTQDLSEPETSEAESHTDSAEARTHYRDVSAQQSVGYTATLSSAPAFKTAHSHLDVPGKSPKRKQPSAQDEGSNRVDASPSAISSTSGVPDFGAHREFSVSMSSFGGIELLQVLCMSLEGRVVV